MLILLLFVLAYSDYLSPSIQIRLQKEQGSSLSLSDLELRNIVYSDFSEIFILFYDSQNTTDSDLLSNWNTSAALVHESGYRVSFASVDTNFHKSMLRRLLLQDFPVALFFRAGHFNNYYGPFDPISVLAVIAEKKYLASPAFSSPKSMNMFEFLLKTVKQGIYANWVIVLNLGIMLVAVFIVLFYLLYVGFKAKAKTE